MREIKFRGKSIMEGTYGLWLYSCGIKYGDDVELMYCDEDTSEEWHYVDKETVGQFTGLHDKNGKEIYEGDIIPFTMIDGKQENYYIIFRDGEFDAINKEDTNFIWRSAWKESVIIGNIYDNPELLEV